MNELFAVLLTAAGCTFLSWQAPRLASGLMSGSPHLGAGDVADHATAAAGVAGAVGGAIGGFAATRAAAAPNGGTRGYGAATASGSASALMGAGAGFGSAPSFRAGGGGAASAAFGPVPAHASLVKSINRMPSPAADHAVLS
jgi:type IV secretion system protein TrbL